MSIDEWRDYFSGANSDIFDVIEHAIVIGAMDYPKDFKLRRDRIAKLLISRKVSKCLSSESCDGDEKEDESSRLDSKHQFQACKNSEMNNGYNEDAEVDYVSNYTNREDEGLTDKIEEETLTIEEVLMIKEILGNHKNESDSMLFNSLRRLQLMGLSVEILKATVIGKSVKVLVKQGSDQVKKLAKTLVKDWMAMVDEWLKATESVSNVTEGTSESGVVDKEGGLPTPPLDEGVFVLTDTSPIQWGEFFDGMDDNGNPQSSGEFKKNRENGRNPVVKNSSDDKQKPLVKPNKPSLLTKPEVEENMNYELKSQKKPDGVKLQQNKSRDPDLVKLEASKRKLHERYQEAENAKKQRKIQVLELHEIPKNQKNPHARPGNHGRR